jgi:hypothetical protein
VRTLVGVRAAIVTRRQEQEAMSDDAALAAEVSPPTQVEGYSKQRVELVQKAVKEWVRQLVDLGGRNNLVHYRDLKAGTLDLTVANPRALSTLLQGKAVTMASLFPDSEEREGALRRVRTIHNKAKENAEERGIETLSLACGLATWENKRGNWEPSAPVLLRSSALRPLGAARDEFELTLIDEPEVNPTLLHLLKEDFACECDQEKLSTSYSSARLRRTLMTELWRSSFEATAPTSSHQPPASGGSQLRTPSGRETNTESRRRSFSTRLASSVVICQCGIWS